MIKKPTPDKVALNLEILEVANNYFSKEKNPIHQRSKAFQHICYSVLTGHDYDELNDESIIDGDDEQGFDIFDIRENDRGLNVILINCKSSQNENYSGTEMLKIKNGLNDIFSTKINKVQLLKNKKLVNRIDYLRANKRSVQSIKIYYCVFNGSVIPRQVERYKGEIDENIKSYTDIQYPDAKATFELLAAKDLFTELKKNRQSLLHEILEIPYFDIEKKHKPEITTHEGLRGYITTLNGIEIAKLVVKYGDQLFEKNIRGWLRYNQKNREILDSCRSDSSHLFWFLNNGITIVGDSIIPEDDKSVWIITNLQIVNGQQTARMLSEAYINGELKQDVKLLCRLYETTSNNFISRITKATNSQSAISGRDLMSNDILQIGIQDSLKMHEIFYERQRGEESNFKFKKKISSKNLAQVSLALLCKKPSLARKNIEDNFFNESKYYNEIFKCDPIKLLLAYIVYEYCFSKRMAKNLISYFGALHLSSIIYNKYETQLVKQSNSIINDYLMDKIDFAKYYDEALLILRKKIPDDIIKNETIGSYLSRIEFDNILANVIN